ncbi:hypothetical protein [Streptomyces sp. NPDC008150]|uniref:hypothetical protein n=1 Tax=Streptomyces sp. NPDC008150 TaxID=3364816 RepID=UPI0036E06FC9
MHPDAVPAHPLSPADDTPPRPVPLPGTAIPDGCPPWDGEPVRAWLAALPPRPVSGPVRTITLAALVLLAAGGGCLLSRYAHVPAFLAAFLGLQVVLPAIRPEAPRVTSPLLLVAGAVLSPWPLWGELVGAAVVLASWAVAETRLRSRARQRSAALAATGPVTAPVPPEARAPDRGAVLATLGVLVLVTGVPRAIAAPWWRLADERGVTPSLGWSAIGAGATLLLSAALARRRALVLRRAPVPVLRVLLRESAALDTEVYAAGDTRAARALFTVALTVRDGKSTSDQDGQARFKAVVARGPAVEPGPLREAVLYGPPHDGAELVVVSAAEDPGLPPTTRVSTGPVRPLSEACARRLARTSTAAAARARRAREELAAAVERFSRAEGPVDPVPVRTWHAGVLDRVVALLVVPWAAEALLGDRGPWPSLSGLALVLGGLYLPSRLVWRITADSTGLWCTGWFRVHHVGWDELRVVAWERGELLIGSRWTTFPDRRLRFVRTYLPSRWVTGPHPGALVAARMTAMWRDPALRPGTESDVRRRGRPLWSLVVPLAVSWSAALLLLG